jgi:16S rRNA (cytosine1402-N4)-methyltransferase
VSGRHEPVLLAETLGFLRNGAGLYLDATLGDGGHAEALLAAEPGARLLGCDRDPAALAFARRRLDRFGDRVTFARARFHELERVHASSGSEPLAGALLDLGLSSAQIDDAARGIAFKSEGPLDLRMDPESGEPASTMLARVDEGTLAAALREHGDLTASTRFARAILAAARVGELHTTRDLVRAIERAAGGRVHPRRLAQVFQAIRIWVNGEAEDLEAVLAWLPRAIRPGGIAVTIAYHSGEDRRIKQAWRGRPRSMPTRRLPPTPEERSPEGPWEELTRRVVTPTSTERERNPRARSARLRAFRRKAA